MSANRKFITVTKGIGESRVEMLINTDHIISVEPYDQRGEDRCLIITTHGRERVEESFDEVKSQINSSQSAGSPAKSNSSSRGSELAM